jgi:hypothetical protein
VSAIDVVTGLIEDKASDFVASKVVEHFDERVKAGVYQLGGDSLTTLKNATPITIANSSEASLVLVHGTFSETSGTFSKLWTEHPQLVRTLFDAYQGRVYSITRRWGPARSPTRSPSPKRRRKELACIC